jgi:hypothetical protein
MQASVMFVDCPAYMSDNGSVRCGLPAEVEGRYTMRSTDGPLENAKIRCPRGHWFNGPVEFLALPGAGARAALPDRSGRRGPGEGGLGAAA